MHKAPPIGLMTLLSGTLCLQPTPAEALSLTRSGSTLLIDGEPKPLIAYGAYGLVAEADFDYRTFLNRASDRGMNLVRIWVNYHWTNDLTPYNGARGSYNLESQNDAFYQRLSDFVSYADSQGIVVQVTFFDGVALTGDSGSNRWPYFPYNTAQNQQNYISSPSQFDDTPSTWWSNVTVPLMERVIDTLSSNGNVIYELMNEPDSHGVDTGSASFHDAMIGVIYDRLNRPGTLGSKIISVNSEGIGSPLWNWALGDSRVDLLSYHAHDPSYGNDFNGLAKPILISNDGDITQATDEFGGLSPSDREARVAAFAANTLGSGAPVGHNHLEILDKGLYGSTWLSLDYDPDVSRMDDGLLWTLAPWAPGDGDIYQDLGEDQGVGLRHPQPGDGDTTQATAAGRACRTNNNPSVDRYFYFAASDGFLFGGDGERVSITIEFLDDSLGTLSLEYDSVGPQDAPTVYKYGGEVAMTATGQWRRHTFEVEDAYFANRQNDGSDFRIGLIGVERAYIDRVEVALGGAVGGGCDSAQGSGSSPWSALGLMMLLGMGGRRSTRRP